MFSRDGQCFIPIPHWFCKGSSQFPHTEEGGNPKGDELEDELMCDVDVDLVANDAFGPGPGTFRCSTRKPRFPPF